MQISGPADDARGSFGVVSRVYSRLKRVIRREGGGESHEKGSPQFKSVDPRMPKMSSAVSRVNDTASSAEVLCWRGIHHSMSREHRRESVDR